MINGIRLLAFVLGCGRGSSDERPAATPAPVASSERTAPNKPANGAPIAMRAKQLHAAGDRGSVEIDAYNFSDRRLALYDIDVFFRDANGKTLDVHEGPITSKSAHTSFTGGTYVCEPRSACQFSVDVPVPAGATAADIVVTRVKTDDNQQVFSAA
jgi:hypothetical protein